MPHVRACVPPRCHQVGPSLARARNLDFSFCFALRVGLKCKTAAVDAYCGDMAFGQRIRVVAAGLRACGVFMFRMSFGREMQTMHFNMPALPAIH